MNKKFFITYTILSAAIFAFSIIFFSLSLYKSYTTGKTTADNRYYNIGLRINNSAQKDVNSFLKNIETTIFDYNEIAAIQIKLDNKIAYSFPTSSPDFTTSRFTKNYSTNFETPIGNMYININIYLLKPVDISYYAKLSFLIILLITLLTIILIIYINISENKSNAVLIEEETNNFNNDENEIESIEADIVYDHDDSIYMEDEEIFDDSEVIPEETSFELIEEETAVNIDELTLNESIENEIGKSIANESDLALFVIQIPGLNNNDEHYNEIKDYLINQFQFKDLVFEYENDCFATLKINMNLEEALDLSDKLLLDIKNVVASQYECFIGISTRSIRMVTGDRLLLEANEALKHAKEDNDSHVVAFRVDADKYREYIEANQK